MNAAPPAADTRHIGQLLRDARDDFLRRLNERRMFDPTPAIMAPAQDLVLRYLDPQGTPVDGILRRTGLPRATFDAIVTGTRHATDYLELDEDGGTLRYTDLGRSTFASIRRTQVAIATSYRTRLGDIRYATLTEALHDLAPRGHTDAAERHVGQLIRDARDDFMRRLSERRMFDAAPIHITPGLDLVLQYLDERGTPLAELCERTGLPAAGLDAIVTEIMLPTRFVEVTGDGVLRYTPIGISAMAHLRRTVAAIEEAHLSRLGPLRYATLKEALAEIAPPRPGFTPSRA